MTDLGESAPIGIIAGGGQFPFLFARAAKKHGRPVVVVAHRGETPPEISTVADRLHWVKIGQLGKIISCLRAEGVRETVMLGTITKTRIFRDVLPDFRALSLWRRSREHHDDTLLRAMADELAGEGIRVVESTLYLKDLLFPQGLLTLKGPSAEQLEDIRCGWRAARAIGGLDIGQTVVVRHQTVLAVEAIEGTDAAIRRGGELGHEQVVVVKLKKPRQDFRFDLPAIGPRTIAVMREVKAAVLAVEAGQSLFFDPETATRAANDAGIVVIGLTESADGLSFP